MTVLDMAKMYYPRLWNEARLESLVEARKLSWNEMREVIQNAEKNSG